MCDTTMTKLMLDTIMGKDVLEKWFQIMTTVRNLTTTEIL